MLTLTLWSQAEGLDWSYQTLVPRRHWTNYGRDKIWLVGCLCFEPRLVQSQLEVCDFCQALRWSRRAWGRECGSWPDFASYTLAFALRRRKYHGKPQSGYPKGARLISAERDSFSQHCQRGHWPRMACWPLWPLAYASGDGVNPRSAKYLTICRTRGFTTSANLESKLAVRALMWLANSTTPRSLCIFLLRTRRHHQQGEDTWIATLVASGNGCGQRTSTRRTHTPSWGGWAAYKAGLRSWRRDYSSYSGGDPAYPSFEPFSFWPERCEAASWVVYLGSPPDNELCHLIGLVPWKELLIGAERGRLASAKIIAVLLETLVAFLYSLSHRWRSLKYDSG
jgi:hypothetical protein